MVTYICINCDKVFVNKNFYVKHLNRKFPCSKKLNPNVSEIAHKNSEKAIDIDQIIEINNKKDYICYYCNKKFSKSSNLIRHVKENCKIKKQQEQKKEDKYNQLIERIENLENQLAEERKKNQNQIITQNIETQNTQNIETQNTHNGDNIVNINLIAYGKENLEKIDIKYILEALKRGISSIPVIAERIHFNVKYPEFQNVYITNMNQKYGMVYDGQEWILKDKDTIIDDMYEKKYDFLDENFETIYTQLSESQQKAFRRFLDIHEKADTNKQFKKIINKIKQDLKFLLYNKKKIPIENHNNKSNQINNN